MDKNCGYWKIDIKFEIDKFSIFILKILIRRVAWTNQDERFDEEMVKDLSKTLEESKLSLDDASEEQVDAELTVYPSPETTLNWRIKGEHLSYTGNLIYLSRAAMEEEKIDNQGNRKKPQESLLRKNDRIIDARSESRQQFTKIKIEDPRERLRELLLQQAKDRRQSIIEQNRSKKKDPKTQVDPKTPIQLQIMIKEITQALNCFMETTNKEIENIKRVVDLNFRGFKEEHEELKKYKDEAKNKMQNIIIFQKELNQKWEAIGSLVEGMIEGSSHTETSGNNLEYSKYKKYKEDINEKLKFRSYHRNTKQQNWPPDLKAILYDRYIPNRVKVVTNSNNVIRTYKVSISYRYNYKIFYVKYKNRWTPLKDNIDRLRNEGLVYGFRNIINILRLKKTNKSKTLKTSKENSIKTDIEKKEPKINQ